MHDAALYHVSVIIVQELATETNTRGLGLFVLLDPENRVGVRCVPSVGLGQVSMCVCVCVPE